MESNLLGCVSAVLLGALPRICSMKVEEELCYVASEARFEGEASK